MTIYHVQHCCLVLRGFPTTMLRATIARNIDACPLDVSDTQYRLRARMIVNGIHSSNKDTPPKVPMISGITPTRPAKK